MIVDAAGLMLKNLNMPSGFTNITIAAVENLNTIVYFGEEEEVMSVEDGSRSATLLLNC